jgi:hypothetical protein
MNHIFVSYSRKDTAAMQRIVHSLSTNGLAVWTDEKLTPGTQDWKVSVERAIENAVAIVALLSPDAKASEWVSRELAYATVRKLLVIPILIRGDAATSVPLELMNSQWLDLTRDESYEPGMRQVVKALQTFTKRTSQSKYQRIYAHLQQIATQHEGLSSVALVTVDGLTAGFYSKSAFTEEDRLSAMAAANLSLGERVTDELGLGAWTYAITAGKTGTCFQLAVGDEYVLLCVMQAVSSLDRTIASILATLPALEALVQLKA